MTTNTTAAPRQKIAVLGGGVAALSAVYGLTNQADWSDRYEVTVYQLGWRLGGKGATGRQRDAGARVLEHGFHSWFGFYENAFRMIRAVYQELGRGPDEPLATWEQAFLPQTRVVLQQEFRGRQTDWVLDIPTNDASPGDGLPTPGPLDYLQEVAQLMLTLCKAALGVDTPAPEAAEPPPAPTGLSALADRVVGKLRHSALERLDPLWWMGKVVKLLGETRDLFSAPAGDEPDGYPLLCAAIRGVIKAVTATVGARAEDDLETARLLLSVEFLGINLIGILSYRLFARGFHSINQYDYREWLRTLGMSERTLHSALTRAGYDSVFSGLNRTPVKVEAGTVLQGGIRQLLLYKGAPLWHFAAGTGDTVFAPLYQVLRRRGVRFRFFHKITELRAERDELGTPTITAVHFEQQVALKTDSYDPLIELDGLPCWPDQPRWEQLVDGDDLESYYSRQKGTAGTLVAGEDFDQVICAISVGALERMTPTLCELSPAWAAMVTGLQTTRTQGIQLWMSPKPEELGWGLGDALVCCDGCPMDTIAEMSFLIRGAERWPSGASPQSLTYFCGTMDGDDTLPPYSDTDYPRRQYSRVVQAATDTLVATGSTPPRMLPFWSKAYSGDGEEPQFRWELLFDTSDQVGPERIKAQWLRANVEPSERYVLSAPGTSALRLRSDQSGFSRLFLAGDWTANGLNAGCMEAAVISGLQASRGICGSPELIPGEGDGVLGLTAP